MFYPVDLMESALSPFFLFVHETQSDYVRGEHSIVHTQGRALKAMTSTAVSHRHCTSLLDVVQAITYLYV